MLGDGLERGRVALRQALIDPQIPEHRGDIIASLPIGDALDPQDRVALVGDGRPASDRERARIVGGDDLGKQPARIGGAVHLLDEALAELQVVDGIEQG